MSNASTAEPTVGPLDLTPKRRAWLTFGVMMGLFLGALEATAVGTAMPTVISSLGGLDLYSWVYSIYFLTMTVSTPLWGRLSDLYGRRNFYVLGIVFFLVGSVLSGLSQSMLQLIWSRAAQGLGAGALIPLGMTIAGDMFSLEKRARVQGLFSGVYGLSSLVGPLLGGLITDSLSWRWVFFLNLPFGVAAGAIIGMGLVEPKIREKRKPDIAGALFLIASLCLILLGLDRWAKVEAHGATLLLMLAGLLLLAAFLVTEQRAEDPILPLSLFQDRIFTAAALTGCFSGMALFGAISFIPLFVQGVRGTAATGAGLALTPLMLGWVILSVVGTRLLLIVGYRKTVVSGMAGLAAGFFMLSRVTPHTSLSHLTWILVLIGSGMGLSMITMLLAVQNRFPRHLLGIATSSTQFFRSIGAAIGIAVMGSVLASQMIGSLADLRSTPHSEEVSYFAHHPDRMVDPITRQGISAETLSQLQGILGGALQKVFLVGFIASLAALAAAFLIPPGSAREHSRRE